MFPLAPSDIERISGLLARLESRLGDPLDPDWAARETAWSLSHFHRKFRAVAGETFQAYLQGRRLHRAAEDLIGTRRPLDRIAEDAAFAHLPAFYKAFRRRYGVAPLAYRRDRADLWHLGREAFSPAFLSHVFGGGVDLEPALVTEPARACVGPIASGEWSEFDRFFITFRADLARIGAHPASIRLKFEASREDVIARMMTVRIGIDAGILEKPPAGWAAFGIPGGLCARFRHHGGSHAFTCSHIWRHWPGRHRLLDADGYSIRMEYDGTNPFTGRRPLEFLLPIAA